jgi:hypothetical protein
LHNNLLWYSANLVVAAVSRPTEGYEERQRGQHQRGYRLPISILIHLFCFSFYIFIQSLYLSAGLCVFPV